MATAPSSSSLLRRSLQSPSSIKENYSMNGKIVVAALVIIFFIVFLIIMLHFYARSLRRSFISRRLSPPSRDAAPSGLHACTGLSKETVEALPVFTYKSQSLSPVECVVCLLDFRQGEECKILPECKHFFHMGCIDMWFLSNTTCPLCRRAVDPSEDRHEAYDMVGSASSSSYGNPHGVNELREQHEGAVVPSKSSKDDAASGYLHDDGDESRDALLHDHFSLQLPVTAPRSCRRSTSEKFSTRTQEAPLPTTNASFWGNHAHTPARMNPTHWRIGGKSFSHVIDMRRCQENPMAVSSCPLRQSSPELCSLTNSAQLSAQARQQTQGTKWGPSQPVKNLGGKEEDLKV